MRRQGVSGIVHSDSYKFDLDDLENFAALHVSNCSILDIPEWLVDYGIAAHEILVRLEAGDYDLPANEMLRLRKRLLMRQKELGAVGAAHGFYLKTAHWFTR